MHKEKKTLMINRIVAFFLIFNILSIFCFTYLVIVREEKKSLNYKKTSMEEIVTEKCSLVNIVFDRIESQMESMGIWIDKVKDNEYSSELSDQYYYDNIGNLVREKNPALRDIEQSNVLIPKDVEKDSELIKSINFTEVFDEAFSSILESEEVTWAYITTEENALRCSPYKVLGNRFSNNHNQRMDIFYTSANESNNPERRIVWTEPYMDYLGTGWTITCSMPIYDCNDKFFGVVSLDISIKNIEKKYFDGFSEGEKGKVYWIKNNGDILYSNIVEGNESQGQTLGKNILKGDYASDKKRQAIKAAIKNKKGIEYYIDNNREKMMVYAPIEKLDSLLIVEVDSNEFLQGIELDFKYIVIIAIMDLIMISFFVVLFNYSFSRPMKKLVNCATRIENGDYKYIQENYDTTSSYYEIIQLNKAFMAMNRSLEAYSQKIKKKNEDISAILDTIECNLVAIDMDGNIKLQTKEKNSISQSDISKAIKYISEKKEAFSEEKIVEGQVYKNKYYPVKTKEGEIERIIVYSECITETHLMEIAFQQLEKMAGVGQLSAAIVHELKNIMARINGAAYILSLNNQSSASLKEVQTIQKSIEEAENVIVTLLDFSKKEPDGKEIIHIETMINQIILLSKKEIIEKSIQVTTTIESELYWISGYKEALKVIIQNLISNAIQAIDTEGEIVIESFEEVDYIIIKIKDDGAGISIEPKEDIFKAFVTTKKSGTGIGLWIVKKLIDSMNGKIEVNERLENGSEFIIYLPIERRKSNEDNTCIIS